MLSPNQLKISFVFFVSYFVLFFLSSLSNITGLRGWGPFGDIFRIDYFFYLIPIPGFFMIFLLIDWIEEFFESKFTRTIWFPLLFFVLGFIAFYIASFWYFCNIFSSSDASFCSSNGSTQTFSFLSANAPSKNIVLNFLSNGLPFSGILSPFLSSNIVRIFLESAFIVFLLAGILGWLSKLLYFKLEEAQNQ